MEDVPGRQLDQDVKEELLGQTHPAHDDTLSLVLVTGHLIWSLEVDFGVISPVGQWWISSLTAL